MAANHNNIKTKKLLLCLKQYLHPVEARQTKPTKENTSPHS